MSCGKRKRNNSISDLKALLFVQCGTLLTSDGTKPSMIVAAGARTGATGRKAYVDIEGLGPAALHQIHLRSVTHYHLIQLKVPDKESAVVLS